MGRLAEALKEAGLTGECRTASAFYPHAIEQREYFKFEFTKSLSLILELLVRAGNGWRSPEMICPGWRLRILVAAVFDGGGLKDQLEVKIRRRHKRYQQFRELSLPEVILNRESLDVVEVYEARPNFITTKRIEGEVVLLEEEPGVDIHDKIVVVPKADPGYEWVFAKGNQRIYYLLWWCGFPYGDPMCGI